VSYSNQNASQKNYTDLLVSFPEDESNN
jgi:hypothetical protein